MVKLAPITIPTKPIGSNPRPTDLIERVAPKGAVRVVGVSAPVDPILRPRKKGPTVFVPSRKELALALERRLIFN
jgi:hypothetical protein